VKKYFLFVVASAVILLGGVFFFTKNQGNAMPLSTPPPITSYEYFWGDGCPHCANVEEFMKTWEKKDQTNIQKLEVWSNRENAQLMQERAKSCGIAPSGMGVPFLVTPEGKCLSGDTPIIELFKSL